MCVHFVLQCRVRETFRQFDENRDGWLPPLDFKSALQQMHLTKNDEEANRVICTLAKNDTGEVQYEEYLDLVLNKHALGNNAREGAEDNVLLAAPWEQVKCDFKLSSSNGAVPPPKFDCPDIEDGSYKQQVQYVPLP